MGLGPFRSLISHAVQRLQLGLGLYYLDCLRTCGITADAIPSISQIQYNIIMYHAQRIIVHIHMQNKIITFLGLLVTSKSLKWGMRSKTATEESKTIPSSSFGSGHSHIFRHSQGHAPNLSKLAQLALPIHQGL